MKENLSPNINPKCIHNNGLRKADKHGSPPHNKQALYTVTPSESQNAD